MYNLGIKLNISEICGVHRRGFGSYLLALSNNYTIPRTLHISCSLSVPFRIARFPVCISTLVHQTERDLINKLVQIFVRAALRLTPTRSSIGASLRPRSRSVINARASIHAKRARESARSRGLIKRGERSLKILKTRRCTRKKLSKLRGAPLFPTRARAICSTIFVSVVVLHRHVYA